MNSDTTGEFRKPGWALAALFLTGCAATGAATGDASESEYLPGSGYHLLMAEIASRRGAQATAADEYLNAAERSDEVEVSQRAAEFAFEYGFDAYALRAARRWSQLAPDEGAANLVIARLLIRRNDVAAATAQADKALGPAVARVDEDYLLLAGEFGEEDNNEAVTRVMTRLAANAPESPALRLAVGTAALNSRDLDLALVSARAVLAASPDGDLANEAGALLGRALLARGDTDAALAELAARVKAGASLDLELEYAGLLAAAERPSEALAAIDGMTARYGAEAEVRRLRALVSLNAGDLKTAWEGFSALLNDGEFADESHFYLAEIAAKQERYDQALQLLGRVGNGPFLLPAQDAISRIAEASGDAESAQQLLKRLAERYPQLAFQADRYRAALMQRLGQDQPALDLLSQMLFYRPDDAGLLLSRGALLEKMGQLDAAVTDMRAAVKLLPDSALTLNALGYTLANRTARYDEAYALIRRAIEREPGSAAILDSYGWVLCRQRKLPEARSYLQLAYSQFPDPEVAAHLGEAMWQQGDRDPARRLWEEALEGDPASQPLKDTMARFIK